MKTRNIATALGGALALAAATSVSAADSWSTMTMKPLMATSLDAGGAHVVSYFQSVDGACRLTLMMADASDGGAKTPARIQLTIAPDRTASVDDADGKSSRFTCLKSAEAMNVIRADRFAAHQPAEEE